MNQISLSDLRLEVEVILRAKQYKESCIKRYSHTWGHMQEYMDAHGINFYTEDAGIGFLAEWHNGKSYNVLTDRQKERVRHITVLTDVVTRGTISKHCRTKRVFIFEGDLGQPFNDFIEYASSMKKGSSLKRYQERINNLYRFLLERDKKLKDFDILLGMVFLRQLDQEKSTVDRNNIIMTVRIFIRYLCEKGVLSENQPFKWMSLMAIRYIRTPQIPSVYTLEEVEAMLSSVDRAHPQGKRDYAMVLLAARYGLRISDINGLRFNNLDWERNRISIIQQKTGKRVNLPLSEEVGNAIIEYLRYGRPPIDLPYVFITAHAPYKELSGSTLGKCMIDWMRVAGINSAGRKHGPHALRHSLATNLLKSREALPVISEILGHSTTDSTMKYLRVDMNLLRQCALNVPFVPSTFYNNLYE